MTMDELAAEVHRKNCIDGTHDDACTAISNMRESLAAAKKFAEQYEGFIASEDCKLDEARKHAATLCLCEHNHRCIWCVVEEAQAKSDTLQEIVNSTTNQIDYWMNQYETMHEQASDLARNLGDSRAEIAQLRTESTLHDEFVSEIINTNSFAIDIDELGDAQTPEDLAVAYVRALEETVVALRAQLAAAREKWMAALDLNAANRDGYDTGKSHAPTEVSDDPASAR